MTQSKPPGTQRQPTSDGAKEDAAEFRGEALAVRGVIGGALMGLANLVPGISGGTMLLAVGIYPQFINGVAEVSTFRLRKKTILLLACVVVAAITAIVGFASPISYLVVHHRWAMYSLFIGLTLGGVPILWSMIRPPNATVVIMAIIGIAIMASLALIQPGNDSGAVSDGHPYVLYFLAGIAGASAMVLPGVSGAYLLLILGQYVVILTTVAQAKDAVSGQDWNAAAQTLHVVIPVGLGVLIGIVGVSNLLKLLLARFEPATLGLLLGLLLGAVIGLWPFQEGIAPEVGSMFRGETVELVDGALRTQQTGKLIEAADYPTSFFQPSIGQVAGAFGAGADRVWRIVRRLASWKPQAVEVNRCAKVCAVRVDGPNPGAG